MWTLFLDDRRNKTKNPESYLEIKYIESIHSSRTRINTHHNDTRETVLSKRAAPTEKGSGRNSLCCSTRWREKEQEGKHIAMGALCWVEMSSSWGIDCCAKHSQPGEIWKYGNYVRLCAPPSAESREFILIYSNLMRQIRRDIANAFVRHFNYNTAGAVYYV